MLKRTNINYPNNATEVFGVSKSDNQLNLLFRSKRRGHNKLGFAQSIDGVKFFEQDSPVLMSGNNKSVNVEQINQAQLVHVLDEQVITLSLDNKLAIGISEIDPDLDIPIWQLVKRGLPNAEAGSIVSELKYNNQFVLYHSKNDIKVSYSKNLKSWHGSNNSLIRSRKNGFDKGKIKIVSSQLVSQGILVVYQSSFKQHKKQVIRLGAALFHRSDPEKLIWQSQSALLELELKQSDKFQILGSIADDDSINFFITSKNDRLFKLTIPSPLSPIKPISDENLKLKKHHANPIIKPEGGEEWEQGGTFNPAAIFYNDSFHMFYRAMAPDGVSRFGYASSRDGLDFTREGKVAYDHSLVSSPPKGLPRRHDLSIYPSGGGWGGCEDPRAVVIDDYLYLSFCVFEGWYSMRQAFTKIKLDDLEKKNWKWSKPVLMSPKNQRQKNWMIFPEKINGKFAIVHALSPRVKIDYVEDLDELAINPITSPIQGDSDRLNGLGWDGFLRGASAPPIKTDAGWLLFYHGTDPKDPSSGYRLGAMILDLNDPSQVIARTTSPILEPSEWYEHNHKPNVIYASAAVVKDDQLYVYYGGGDRHVCVATTSLSKFVDDLIKRKQVHLQG